MCTEKELHPGCFTGKYLKTFKAVIFPKQQWTDAPETSNRRYHREINIFSKGVMMP